jgi:hypothetical protein
MKRIDITPTLYEVVLVPFFPKRCTPIRLDNFITNQNEA